MKCCTRMAICEALTDDHIKEIISRMEDHTRDIPGLVGHSILVEEGGKMVILVTDWNNRQDCLTYHASGAYRRLVASTQHMLVGDYVVKLFQNRDRMRHHAIPLATTSGLGKAQL